MKDNPKIIGLLGFKGAGKDTVAKLLTEYNYYPVSFAENLKHVLSILFGWDKEMLDGHTVESRKWRDQIDHWWAEKLGIPDFTPRKAMTMVGTDLFRKHFSDQIWILSLHKKIDDIQKQQSCNIVITDIRFKNEFDYVKQIADKTYRIDRYRYDWEHIGYKASQGEPSSIQYMNNVLKVHQSEWDWLSCDWDDEIDNTKNDMSHLMKEIETKIIENNK